MKLIDYLACFVLVTSVIVFMAGDLLLNPFPLASVNAMYENW